MSKAVIMAGWDDVPHLSEAEKARLLAITPPAFRDSRSKGIPRIGAGAIYPVEFDAFVVEDFELARHWPRGYGFDVGWKATAALYIAWDRDPGKDIMYAYREYKRGEQEPSVHAHSIRLKAEELTGASDPAAHSRNIRDGRVLFTEYEALGLKLVNAMNAVEAGLLEVYERLTSGRLKIFKSLGKTLNEMRLYRRNDKGQIVKEHDHLMDCLRYAVMTANDAITWVPAKPASDEGRRRNRGGPDAWMAN